MDEQINRLTRQLSAYFLVGGAAAIVEWASFFLFNKVISFHYIVATTFAFVIATYVNWVLGKRTLFRASNLTLNKAQEFSAIYLVSLIGLLWNVLIMFLLIERYMFDEMLSKVLATGIVFVWNFILRKKFIYKI
jgi:putative flippase GtrA